MYKANCVECSESIQVSELIGKNPSWFEVLCPDCELELGLLV
jgi:hypothetical protein